MAYTITNRRPINPGDLDGFICDIDITSYTTNGEDFAAESLGVDGRPVMITLISTEKENLIPRWVRASDLMKLIVTTTGAELANGGDGGTWRMKVESV